MASNLFEIAELAWRQITGGGGDETSITLEEVVASARLLYATEMLNNSRLERQLNGAYVIPSALLLEDEINIKNNEADISHLNILTALPNELWVQDIGGVSCECKYVKSNVNLSKVLCDDDSLGDNARTFYVVGEKIKFPRGTHATKLPIIYINDGTGINENEIMVDDAIGGIVRVKLNEIYLGRIAPTDVTNNSSPNT